MSSRLRDKQETWPSPIHRHRVLVIIDLPSHQVHVRALSVPKSEDTPSRQNTSLDNWLSFPCSILDNWVSVLLPGNSRKGRGVNQSINCQQKGKSRPSFDPMQWLKTYFKESWFRIVMVEQNISEASLELIRVCQEPLQLMVNLCRASHRWVSFLLFSTCETFERLHAALSW